MPNPDRDRSIVEHMLAYCKEIGTAHDDFGCSYEAFQSRSTYRNAIALCLLQIGELANHLSEAFKAEHPQMPWRQIRGMRNLVAHEYSTMDVEVIWFTSIEDIPQLQAFCEQALHNQ